ncbi:P-loop containing nucleoside triphosphate hydrolase protein [Chiua virens]|nr:P-loop containing nucleoside triphosphate hydrolase protein [Chiua virens]
MPPLSTHDTGVPATSEKSLNIILFGETGVGKSSLVNLIAGKKVTKTSEDMRLCTLKYAPYSFQVHGVSYTIWDTRGLQEADTEVGTKGYLDAIEQAWDLIRDLTNKGGVDLLVLCHKGRLTDATRSNYKLFYEVLCEKKVPIALAATHLERRLQMEDWWVESKKAFDECRMSFAAHACVTGLPDHAKTAESKEAIERLLGQHDDKKRYNMPRNLWIRRVVQHWVRPKGIKESDLQECLRKRCYFPAREAQEIAEVLLRSSTEEYNSDGSSGQASPSQPSIHQRST